MSEKAHEGTEELLERGYRVHGRVQGVGFRWWTRAVATELGVEGLVRNLSDGSVEVMARASEEVLNALEGRLMEGPRLSRVERCEGIECALPQGHTGFSIDH